MKAINPAKISRIFHSLRTQLILYYIAISLVILAVGSYLSYVYIVGMLKNNNEKYLLQQFSQADYSIQSMVSETERLSKLFLLDPDIQKFLQDNYDSSEFTGVEMQNAILSKITQYVSNYKFLNSIYIFTENGGGIGGSDRNTSILRGDESNIEFFSSGMYKRTKEAFPKAILEGGITEEFYRKYGTKNKTFIISMARGVKPISMPNRNAILVFNIDERYISSIFANSGSFKDGDIYIADRNKKIISSSDLNYSGNVFPSYANIDFASDYGSFTYKKNGLTMQGVYYNLKNTDWYLVGEVPLQNLTGDINFLKKILIIVFAVSVIAIFAISFFLLRIIIKPLHIIAGKMRDVGRGNLGITLSKVPRNEIGIVVKRFNEMSLNMVELINKNNEIQDEKRRLEIEALQYQINPHFLFNTLNVIKWMATVIEAKNIEDSIVSLGNILRRLFSSKSPMCTIQEELYYLENYVEIINYRFSNSVRFTFAIEESILNCHIPRFILQPVIENSITHGTQRQRNGIDINVSASVQQNNLQIIISDTGAGIDDNRLEEINGMLADPLKKFESNPEGNIGLYNVNRRIRLYFGDEYGIRINNSQKGGAEVILKIPVNH